MTAIKIIADDVKLNIAVAALKNPDLKNRELAEMFDVSETTVKRSKKNYAEDALKVFEAEKAAEAEKLAAKNKPSKKAKAEDVPVGKKGYKPRNGRWMILDAMFAELGFEDSAKLYEEANKRGVAAGLPLLNRASFYAMLCIARKKNREAEAAAVKKS